MHPPGPTGPAISVRACRASGVGTDHAASRWSSSPSSSRSCSSCSPGRRTSGRAFYAYVAIENGVKEGAFYGARAPLCTDDTSAGCGNPRNVEWRVRNELENLKNPDGTQLTPTVECLDQVSGTAHPSMTDCAERRHLQGHPLVSVQAPDPDPGRHPRRHPRPQRRLLGRRAQPCLRPDAWRLRPEAGQGRERRQRRHDREQLPRARRVRLGRLLPQPVPQHDDARPRRHHLGHVRVRASRSSTRSPSATAAASR